MLIKLHTQLNRQILLVSVYFSRLILSICLSLYHLSDSKCTKSITTYFISLLLFESIIVYYKKPDFRRLNKLFLIQTCNVKQYNIEYNNTTEFGHMIMKKEDDSVTQRNCNFINLRKLQHFEFLK